MKQVSANQQEVNIGVDGFSNNFRQAVKEIFVTLRFAGGVAVGFAEMDI